MAVRLQSSRMSLSPLAFPQQPVFGMAPLTQHEILRFIQNDWAEYVPRFRRLPAESQATFLAEQGYSRFADLLSHIAAWWRVGLQSIEGYLADPTAPPSEYNVAAFNAEAVANAAGLAEDQVVAAFEAMRHALIDFVKGLPDAAFENEKVVRQLSLEVVGHFKEHEVPARE